MSTFFKYLILVAIFITSAHTPHAQAETWVGVSPLLIDVSATGRDIIKKEVEVTNTASQPITLYPTVNNISLKAGGGIETFLPAVMSDRATSLASWIEISRQGIDLQVGQKKTIPFVIRVDREPEPGTYHALIGFEYGNNRDDAERKLLEGNVPGVIVNVVIEKKNTGFLKLSKFIVDRFVVKQDNEAASFTFTNPSEEELIPKGEIIIYDSSGKEVSSLRVNDESVTIPPKGEYTFTSQIPISNLFGRYKAFLSVEYGTTQRASLQDTNFFYVFPIQKIVFVLVSMVVAVIFISWRIHHRYFNSATNDDSDYLHVHIKEGQSEPMHHDIDLSKRNHENLS